MSDSDEDALDIFSKALGMFGDVDECHGEPGGTWTHTYPAESALGGRAVQLHLNESTAGNQKLFAHYVWNSAIVLSDLLAGGRVQALDGRSVCEMGAGSGLPSLTAAALGARAVVATDYPDEEVLAALRRNVAAQEAREDGFSLPAGRCVVAPHTWGEDTSPVLAALRGMPNESDASAFDVVICADTLWMPEQHANLARSVRALLAPDGVAIVAFTLQHDQTFEFFEVRGRSRVLTACLSLHRPLSLTPWLPAQTAAEHGLASKEVAVEKIPVTWGGVEAEDVDDHTESKRTVWVYLMWHE